MGKVFIIAIYSLWIPYNYDKCLIGTTGGDEWSKFQSNMASVFWENLGQLFFSRQLQQRQEQP